MFICGILECLATHRPQPRSKTVKVCWIEREFPLSGVDVKVTGDADITCRRWQNVWKPAALEKPASPRIIESGIRVCHHVTAIAEHQQRNCRN